jgi:hypothetical protein
MGQAGTLARFGQNALEEHVAAQAFVSRSAARWQILRMIRI